MTSREVHGQASRRPSTGGIAAVRAGGDHHGVAGLQHADGAVVRGDLDRSLAGQAPAASHDIDPGAGGPLDLATVVVIVGEPIAPAEDRREVERAGQRLRDSGHRPRGVQSSTGRSRALLGMHAQ